ncbi:MAG TPA: Flp family type IVb pilin [Symbiobacteriaceae bacterium]|jgi:Flp pilus assembly pilin Flp|nr:Flp family type IVb pilin [Symbiobacteriaceae bacterium]
MRPAALRRLCSEEEGQGLVEYLMIIALVALGLFTVLDTLSETLVGFIGQVMAALETMVP